jgi:hypothetical protein
METRNNDKTTSPVLPAPAELTDTQLAFVSGGLNPQPLPPRVEPDRI